LSYFYFRTDTDSCSIAYNFWYHVIEQDNQLAVCEQL
jgi:hypothetical protein